MHIDLCWIFRIEKTYFMLKIIIVIFKFYLGNFVSLKTVVSSDDEGNITYII